MILFVVGLPFVYLSYRRVSILKDLAKLNGVEFFEKATIELFDEIVSTKHSIFKVGAGSLNKKILHSVRSCKRQAYQAHKLY